MQELRLEIWESLWIQCEHLHSCSKFKDMSTGRFANLQDMCNLMVKEIDEKVRAQSSGITLWAEE